MSLAWYAVTVHPKHEALAERGLRAQQMETYLPLHTVRRRWSDRMKTLTTVLFPGYVFCRFTPRDKLRVLSAPGVRGIVSRGRDPLAVDDAEIASLRAVLATGRPVEVCPYLRAGEAVRIAAGPLAGVRGVILRARGHWRVVVGVEALGSSVSVEVDACQLLPDRNPPAALPTIPQRGAHAHYQA